VAKKSFWGKRRGGLPQKRKSLVKKHGDPATIFFTWCNKKTFQKRGFHDKRVKGKVKNAVLLPVKCWE